MRVCVAVSRTVTFRGVFLGVLCLVSCWILVGYPIVTLDRRAILAFIILPSHVIYTIVLRPHGGTSAILGTFKMPEYLTGSL